MSNFLLDTFTGSGSLATHVPEQNTWTVPATYGGDGLPSAGGSDTFLADPDLTKYLLDGSGALQMDLSRALDDYDATINLIPGSSPTAAAYALEITLALPAYADVALGYSVYVGLSGRMSLDGFGSWNAVCASLAIEANTFRNRWECYTQAFFEGSGAAGVQWGDNIGRPWNEIDPPLPGDSYSLGTGAQTITFRAEWNGRVLRMYLNGHPQTIIAYDAVTGDPLPEHTQDIYWQDSAVFDAAGKCGISVWFQNFDYGVETASLVKVGSILGTYDLLTVPGGSGSGDFFAAEFDGSGTLEGYVPEIGEPLLSIGRQDAISTVNEYVVPLTYLKRADGLWQFDFTNPQNSYLILANEVALPIADYYAEITFVLPPTGSSIISFNFGIGGRDYVLPGDDNYYGVFLAGFLGYYGTPGGNWTIELYQDSVSYDDFDPTGDLDFVGSVPGLSSVTLRAEWEGRSLRLLLNGELKITRTWVETEFDLPGGVHFSFNFGAYGDATQFFPVGIERMRYGPLGGGGGSFWTDFDLTQETLPGGLRTLTEAPALALQVLDPMVFFPKVQPKPRPTPQPLSGFLTDSFDGSGTPDPLKWARFPLMFRYFGLVGVGDITQFSGRLTFNPPPTTTNSKFGEMWSVNATPWPDASISADVFWNGSNSSGNLYLGVRMQSVGPDVAGYFLSLSNHTSGGVTTGIDWSLAYRNLSGSDQYLFANQGTFSGLAATFKLDITGTVLTLSINGSVVSTSVAISGSTTTAGRASISSDAGANGIGPGYFSVDNVAVTASSPPVEPPGADWVLDTFTGSENTLITAHTGEVGATWTENLLLWDANAFRLKSNRLSRTTSADSAIGSLGPASCYPSGRLPAGTTNYTVEMAVTIDSNADSTSIEIWHKADLHSPEVVLAFQNTRYSGAGHEIYLYTGSSTVEASFTHSYGTEYVIKLRVTGTLIEYLIDDVVKITATRTQPLVEPFGLMLMDHSGFGYPHVNYFKIYTPGVAVSGSFWTDFDLTKETLPGGLLAPAEAPAPALALPTLDPMVFFPKVQPPKPRPKTGVVYCNAVGATECYAAGMSGVMASGSDIGVYLEYTAPPTSTITVYGYSANVFTPASDAGPGGQGLWINNDSGGPYPAGSTAVMKYLGAQFIDGSDYFMQTGWKKTGTGISRNAVASLTPPMISSPVTIRFRSTDPSFRTVQPVVPLSPDRSEPFAGDAVTGSIFGWCWQFAAATATKFKVYDWGAVDSGGTPPPDPVPPPPTVELFLDTFTGSGTLEMHSPELGGPWTITYDTAYGDATGGIKLDGTGNALLDPAKPLVPGYRVTFPQRPAPGVAFTLEMDVKATVINHGGNIASLVIVVENESGSTYIAVSILSSFLLNSGPPTIPAGVSVLWNALSAGVNLFPASCQSIAANTFFNLKLVVSADYRTASFFLNNASLGAYTFDTPFDIAGSTFGVSWTDGFKDRLTLSRVHLNSGVSAFWTDFDLTRETLP